MGYLLFGDSARVWSFFREHTGLEDLKTCLILTHEKGIPYKVEDLSPLSQYIAETAAFCKYCIIPDADCLTEVCQNKLLKAIEDSDVEFFLFAYTDIFLPTIKSRLQVHWLTQADRSFRFFDDLKKREDILLRCPLDDKGYILPVSVYEFIAQTEQIFLDAFTCPLSAVSSLWNELERVHVTCLCEDYLHRRVPLTRDDLFAFLVQII